MTLDEYIKMRTEKLFVQYADACGDGDYYFAARAMEAINEINRIPLYVTDKEAEQQKLRKMRLWRSSMNRIYLFLYFLTCLLAYFVGRGLGRAISKVIMAFAG